jgi:hemoglobin-like flavoprotein
VSDGEESTPIPAGRFDETHWKGGWSVGVAHGTESARSRSSIHREVRILEPTDSYFRCLRLPSFLEKFYARLLEDDPSTAALFARTEWREQRLKMQAALAMVLLNHSGSRAARGTLRRLGRVHGPQGLNVAPALYARWIEAMLDTVRACDPEWTAEIGGKWRAALTAATDVMLDRTAT